MVKLNKTLLLRLADFKSILNRCKIAKMVIVAQLVRAPDCGSGGRGFEPHLSPNVSLIEKPGLACKAFAVVAIINPFELATGNVSFLLSFI